MPEFDHNNTKYPLRGMHEKVPCLQCHTKPIFANAGKNCQDCHDDIHRRQMGTNCAQCHTVQGWNIAVQAVKDHQNRFPLLGAHAAVQCEDCHKSAAVGQFQGLSTACSSCHLREFQQAKNPDHVAAQFPLACDSCHTFDSWLGATVNHSAPPINFPLTNGHANVPCSNCHVGGNYSLKIAPTDCGNAGCHLTTWQQATNPKHSAAATVFPVAACSTCHNTISWQTANFDHSTTGFPLANSHQMAPAGKVNACTDCHVNNNYNLQISTTDCGNSGCHLTTWQQTNNPSHSAAGTSFAAANCSTCHSATLWTNVVFNHAATGWALAGSHQMAPAGKVAACTDCHVSNNYNFTTANTDCYGCHQTAWNSTPTFGGAVPNHITAGFPTSLCSQCHDTLLWTDSTFNHANTGFPLANSHQIAPAGKVTGCDQCHKGNYSSLAIQPTDCGNAGCHLTTWQQTNNPVHSSGGASFAAANCSTCHNTTTWTTAIFDHSTTGWALAGSHQMAPAGKVAACTDCHVSNNYTFTAANTDCYGCHQTAWNSTPSFGGAVPNHITAGFPTSLCSQCHDTILWTNSSFNHASTGFPLTNSHQIAPAGKVTGCDQCHKGNYSSLAIQPTDCGNAGCHLTTWQQTNNPVHSSAGAPFATGNCSTCHNTTTWTTAVFDHSTTGWALAGSHQLAPAGKVVACTDCHVGNNYTFTTANTDCYGCHQTAWNSTPSFGGAVPNHITAGFPTSLCSQCHDTILWTNSSFNHATTGFPLTNSHQIAPAGKVTGCDQCHKGNYSSLAIQPTDCGNAGCHLTTWQQTNNPVHSSAGAPFATGNCSTCHNTITWTTAVFDHSTTGWALAGSHQLAPAGKVTACTDCHVGNNYTFTAANTDCYGCHQTAWNSTPTFGGAVPNHITAGFPTSLCSQCHDTLLWTDSTFNHANTGFPLTNSHQIAPAGKVTGCDQCHKGNYSSLAIQPTDCGNAGCHLTTWQQTNNPVHSSAGAPFAAANCSTCHNTISWTTAVFDHSTTGWALTGSHQLAPAGKVVACTDCHVGNNYTFTAANTDCYGCHQTAWNSTPSFGGNVPNHITAGFPTSLCSTCHDTLLWTDGKFDHSTTGFPLQGPHMLPPRTTVTGAIGPMVNACTDCHLGGNYTTGYPTTDCYGCHQTYFVNAQNYGASVPNHVAASYPTACISCHTTYVTTAWLGAVFNHTYFRIPHNGSVCADCHINSTNYAIFSCINACHNGNSPHTNKSQTDGKHSGVNGYTYNATICVNCHKS